MFKRCLDQAEVMRDRIPPFEHRHADDPYSTGCLFASAVIAHRLILAFPKLVGAFVKAIFVIALSVRPMM
jgi:hypothetical protein